jgi:hypothetical protein
MRESWSNRGLALPDIDPSVALAQVIRNEVKHRAIFWQRREIDAPSTTGSMRVGKAASGMRNRAFLSLLIPFVLLLGVTSALSQAVACKPLLSTKAVREVRSSSTQSLPWKWHATIMADTGFCATRSGNFEMDFVRIKEYSPDHQFAQTFRWTRDQFDVSMELSADEAILEFRIGFIAPCVCREVGNLSIDPRVK